MSEYSPIVYTSAGPPLSAETLGELEQQLGTSLPEDYRRFLLQTNGGVPSRGTFSLGPDPDLDTYWVDDFVCIDAKLSGPDADLSPGYVSTLAYYRHKFEHRLPREAIPVATVARDSLLLLYVKGEWRGQVHLVSPFEVDEPRLEDVEKTRKFVVASFSEFLEMLEEP